MAVTKRTRFEVLRRDNYTCRYCGAKAPDVEITLDHVTPVALGGGDTSANLVAACVDCNTGKSSTTPGADLVEDVAAADVKWADAVKRAAALFDEQEAAADAYVAAFFGVWPQFRYVPQGAEASVLRLYRAGLPVEMMQVAAGAALNASNVNDRFSYFMGIAWKRVTALQETARQLLAAEERDA